MPVNVACLLPGVDGQEEPGLLINSPSTDWAFIRTSASWSLYSRFPDGPQHFATKPNVACDVGAARLGIRAGRDRRSPSGEKTGSLPIWPPPVTFPAVEGIPPKHGPLGAGARSQGVKSASPTTSSPVPEGLLGTLNGPLDEPHQWRGLYPVRACRAGSRSRR